MSDVSGDDDDDEGMTEEDEMQSYPKENKMFVIEESVDGSGQEQSSGGNGEAQYIAWLTT